MRAAEVGRLASGTGGSCPQEELAPIFTKEKRAPLPVPFLPSETPRRVAPAVLSGTAQPICQFLSGDGPVPWMYMVVAPVADPGLFLLSQREGPKALGAGAGLCLPMRDGAPVSLLGPEGVA